MMFFTVESSLLWLASLSQDECGYGPWHYLAVDYSPKVTHPSFSVGVPEQVNRNLIRTI